MWRCDFGPCQDVDCQCTLRRSSRVDIEPDFVELGRRISARRAAIGLSQEALALAANFNRSYIGKVERGERNVSLRTLCRLCHVLGCDLATLTVGIPKVIEPPIFKS